MLRRALMTLAIVCSPISAHADPKPPTTADRAAAATYAQAMARARKATDAHDIVAAVAAFDAALVAKPHDARALAERGYAKLVGGSDLDGAAADLDRAASATKDTKLLAQIWFNRGLIDEKSPATAANARADFTTANTLAPSKAAAAKLAGGDHKTCPLRFTRAFQVDDADVKPFDAADWLAFAAEIEHPTWASGDAPTTLPAAVTALFGAAGPPKLPTLVPAGDPLLGLSLYYVVAAGTGMHATPVAVASGGHCPGALDFVIAETVGTIARIHGSETIENGTIRTCGDNHEDCTAANTNNEFSGYACAGGTPTERELAIDVSTGKILLVAEHPKPTGPVTITLAGNAFRVTGLGCDRVEPFAK